MSTNTKLQNIVRSIGTIPQRVIKYISSGAIRVFSPSDDNYPSIGVQPFEGEPTDQK